MVRERIADPVILSLIGKWLRAGAMQDGVVVRSEEGTPQGGPISCVLANIYLHRLWKRRDQQRHLWEMLRGFYQYFRLHHCQEKLDWIRREVQLQWRRTLRQQSQRHRLHWSCLASREWFNLPLPPRHSLHPTV